MRVFLLLFAISTIAHSKLTCTRCPFHISPKGRTNCTETCEGDVCIIVVNKYYNGTIIAGCINLYEGDTFKEGPAACYREQHRTLCACTTKDRCNDPTSPIANFKFTDSRILEGYQFTPMIGGGGEKPSGGALDTSKLIEGDTAKPNETNADPVDGVPMVTSETGELVARTMSPNDIVVTKTVSLQIGDGEVPQQQFSTSLPREEHTSPEPDTQGTTTHGNATKASTSYLMSLAMIVGSFTMIIASLMIF